MFSKISARNLFKLSNARAVTRTINCNAVRSMSLNYARNIDDLSIRNVDFLRQKERKRPSSVFNSAKATQLNIPTERKEFMDLFPDVLEDVSEVAEELYKDKDLVDRIIRPVKYNVPNGRQIYAMSLILTYKNLVDPAQQTPENMKMIRLLSWIFEMFLASIEMMDDIVDKGEVRRDQPCWHLLEDVKLNAVNDILLIENLAYCLFDKYFSHLPCYSKLFEEFHQTFLKTVIGVHVELEVARKGVQYFTMVDFRKLSHLKTGYGSANAPFAIVTKFIGIDNPELSRQLNPIFFEMGVFKQIQNDFYGCFSDSGELRKIDSDTEIGQCNWLAVKCMELATPAQRQIMIECFGKQDSEKAKLVKELYEELQLPELYHQYEIETYDKLSATIKTLTCGIPNEAMLNILNMFFNRAS